MIQAFSETSYSGLLKDLAGKDSRLQQILERFGPPPFWTRPRGFPGLARIILEQQVSLASALNTWNRLENRLGRITPEAVLSLPDQDMADLGITRQKRAYIQGLARTLLAPDSTLDLEGLDPLPDDRVKAQLLTVKGIGPWTADIYLIMGLHRRDIFPSGDLALDKALAALDRIPMHSGQAGLSSLPRDAAPCRSLLACLLWHWYIETRGSLDL